MAMQYRQRMRVAWTDTDASGRIHFTASFRWVEAAEHAVFRMLGVGAVADFPRRHVEATYHRPLHFPDEFDLVLTTEKVGHTSFVYAWQAVRDGELCAEGRSVVVHIDAQGVPTPLPGALREGLKG